MTRPPVMRARPAALCVLTAVVLLTGCGGNDSEETEPTPSISAGFPSEPEGHAEAEVPDLPRQEIERASAAAEKLGIAFLTQRSDESPEERAARLRPLTSPGSEIPTLPPPLDAADFMPGTGYATVPRFAPVLSGGTETEPTFFLEVRLKVGIAQPGLTFSDYVTGGYQVSVRKVGGTWKASSLTGKMDLGSPRDEPLGEGPDVGPPEGRPTASLPPPDVRPDVALPAVSIAVTQAAAGFMTERENAFGLPNTTPRSWVSRVKPLMTPSGWQTLSDGVGDGGGIVFRTMQDNRWSVRTDDVSCRYRSRGGPPTSTTATVFCNGETTTVDAEGRSVPESEFPQFWSATGPTDAVLELRKVGGKWLISADRSGAYS